MLILTMSSVISQTNVFISMHHHTSGALQILIATLMLKSVSLVNRYLDLPKKIADVMPKIVA